jgi:hypothetical protein
MIAALNESAKIHERTIREHDHFSDELRRQIQLLRQYIYGPRRERWIEADGTRTPLRAERRGGHDPAARSASR